MPEMFYTTEAISSDPKLSASIALLTDGRFSGATRDLQLDIFHLKQQVVDQLLWLKMEIRLKSV